MSRARIVIAEDYPAMREQVVQLLSPKFEVVEAVGDGRALLDAVARLKPDLVVVDITMPVLGGLEAARLLKESGACPKIVFLTVHGDPDYLRAALDVIADGFVVKSRMVSDLILALEEALAGRRFVSPGATE